MPEEKRNASGTFRPSVLNKDRIAQMAEGIRQVAELEDPVGEVLSMETAPEWTYDWKETCTIRCHWNYL